MLNCIVAITPISYSNVIRFERFTAKLRPACIRPFPRYRKVVLHDRSSILSDIHPCAAIVRSELDMHCKHRGGCFSRVIFVISVQFWIQTCRQKGRGVRASAPIEHEWPRGGPKKT